MTCDASMRLLAAVLATCGASASSACDGLTVTDAWVREAPPGATAVAVYMTLENGGTREVTVDAIRSPSFAHGMLHETVRDGDRVHMRHVASLTLPPGARRSLAPGALHGMLLKPIDTMPREGEAVETVLGCHDQSLTIHIPVRRDGPAR